MSPAKIPLDLDLFQARLADVEARAATAAGDRPAPQVVIVSKYLVEEDTATLRGAGVGPLGENRAQELEAKVGAHEDREGWHFIGHLQRNKLAVVLRESPAFTLSTPNASPRSSIAGSKPTPPTASTASSR